MQSCTEATLARAPESHAARRHTPHSRDSLACANRPALRFTALLDSTAEFPMAIRKARKNLLRRRELKPLNFELRLRIDDISPQIYRDMLLGEGIFLIQLHRAIQSMFGWFDIHEHEFTNDGVRYAEPDEEGRLAHGVRSTLETTVGELALNRHGTFHYIYDFGDRWKLTITVMDIFEQVEPGLTIFPIMLGGERAGPPEDCGGPPGYADLLTVLADPSHPLHQERSEAIGPPFDPEQFDFRTSSHALALLCAWGAI